MTDVHCHVSSGDSTVREFLTGRDFVGVHPWEVAQSGDAESFPLLKEKSLSFIRRQLVENPKLGVGEIGLDRLKEKNISPEMREMFEAQLMLALAFHRPVVLHGAKCWGQVVAEVKNAECKMRNERGRYLFHGFSRSDGLISDIVKLNGYISVGPAVLNDHAVNYRALVKKIPLDRLLLETDRTEENAATCPSVRAVAAKVAEIRGLSSDAFERITDANAEAFAGNLIYYKLQ